MITFPHSYRTRTLSPVGNGCSAVAAATGGTSESWGKLTLP